LRSQARRWKARHGLRLVVIDYLQLMSGDHGLPREQQVASISRGLKVLAKELDAPILVLSQLNRGVEARGDKRPLISDLRESGA
ncbi:DnaB-like helicase C-terminal domain-containing protein, partial [Myxococcota bacterium]|nr:DnaB-like helicase C-terminal domain-containing protein [Myxococcota bacterium]